MAPSTFDIPDREGLGGALAVVAVATGVALFGGVWTAVTEDYAAETSVDAGGDDGDITPLDSDVLEARQPGKSRRLRWTETGRRSFALRIHQRRGGSENEGRRDVRAVVEGTNQIEEIGGVRSAEFRVRSRSVDIEGDGAGDASHLAGMVADVVDGTRYRRIFGEQGHLRAREWPGTDGAEAAPFGRVIAEAIEVSTPRFPAGPVLVGESWHYDPVRRLGRPDEASAVTIEADVEETLDGIYHHRKRGVELGAVDRDIELEVRGPERTVSIEGTGRAYVELDAGILISSTVDLKWRDRLDYRTRVVWRDRGG